ncbi:hypothetical protein M673_20975 (plasmid) [Aureimonas sp. AU20]|nr:hypothetical protein M673_20975 [Aureimonas sp. AU20]
MGRATRFFRPSASACGRQWGRGHDLPLGLDEFLVLVRHADFDEVRNLGTRIIFALSKPVEIDTGILACVGVSVGGALDRDGTALLSDLMR